ncbi:ABC transporter substrate-binding protein [Ruania alba]|uniref:ABC-type nitrate/sulfonate/bicarbonate transport system, substrate-binding protein n=1 Tax=Ruania alba TaxID=648782 RepID=A0A1H5MQ30_9MICO|nr:ABC transporter substrate-binding protein [Ruania alba]SEE91323.1 ABC-type nitrate/sulfonate/bicarbonate transport system, substrate-binding protein [Ruania alba]
MTTRHPSRRRIVAGLALSAVASTGVLAACSDDAGTGGDADAGVLSEASVQLGWFPNVESAPIIVADENGYFADEGIDVTVEPGGPEVNSDAQIVSGNVLMGTLNSEGLANAVIAGADLVAVGAIYQTSSSAIVTLADSGIEEPADLEGRRFGTSPSDDRVYPPFFELVGVGDSQIESVNIGADPAALVSGEVDAMSGTLANQPIALEAQGHDVSTIRLGDYGYNRWSGVLVVRADSLEDETKRATIVAMLRAIAQGTADLVADPDAAAQVVVDTYGEQLGLDPDQQAASAAVWADLASGEAGEPVLLTDDGIASQQDFYDRVGLEVDAGTIFDTSVQEDL